MAQVGAAPAPRHQFNNGRIKALLPIPNSEDFKRLNPEALHPNFNKEKFYPPGPPPGEKDKVDKDPRYFISVCSSRHHMRPDVRGADLERVGVLGVILSFSQPKGDKFYGSTVQQRGAPNTGQGAAVKRTKMSSESLVNSRILICGDAFDSSHLTFCIILPSKTAFINALGNANLSSSLSVGDAILVYEPAKCQRTLGASIPIMSDFLCLVPLKPNLEYIQKPLMMSDEANQQIHFIKQGCTIELSMLKILVGNDVPCCGNSCDRQIKTCKGCIGVGKERTNFVLHANVDVLDQSGYNALTGVADFEFRSYRFTDVVIGNLSHFSLLPYETMNSYTYRIRNAAIAIQEYVNKEGGWTVIGWHRRGIIKTGTEEAPELSTETKGHIVRLEPTRLTKEVMEKINELKFRKKED